MTVFAIALFLIGVAGGLAARFTAAHPLLIAGIGGVPGGILGLLVAGATMSDAAWGFALIAYAACATAAALGAFLGWLRRDNLKGRI